MASMVEIYEGFYVNPWKVTVIKAAEKNKCVVYVSGQSALDGFVVNRNALQVASEIAEAMQEDEEPAEQEENEEPEETDEDEEAPQVSALYGRYR